MSSWKHLWTDPPRRDEVSEGERWSALYTDVYERIKDLDGPTAVYADAEGLVVVLRAPNPPAEKRLKDVYDFPIRIIYGTVHTT